MEDSLKQFYVLKISNLEKQIENLQGLANKNLTVPEVVAVVKQGIVDYANFTATSLYQIIEIAALGLDTGEDPKIVAKHLRMSLSIFDAFNKQAESPMKIDSAI